MHTQINSIAREKVHSRQGEKHDREKATAELARGGGSCGGGGSVPTEVLVLVGGGDAADLAK